MASHDYCEDDDCPCYLAGQKSAHRDVAERSSDVVEAMSRLVEMMTDEDED